jgi:hypothetical protein
MARRVIKGTDYTFSPSTRTIVIPAFILEERLMLITNVSTGTVIYNFADPNLGFTGWSYIGDPTNPKTQVVLEYNTAAMSSTDLLQIMVDDFNEQITYADTLLDAVEKVRTASPQSLMDTDFEYSVQPSKWEALFMACNYPSFFAKTSGGNSFEVATVQGNGAGPRSLVTVTTTTLHNLQAGNVISIQDTLNFRAEGTFVVNSIVTPFQFTYFARGLVDGIINIQNNTVVYGGDIFDNAHIPGGTASTGTLVGFSAASDGGNPTTITVTTPSPHGLYPGIPIMIANSSGMNGNWIVKDVLTPLSFTFQILDTVVTAVSTSASTVLYTKPEGYIQHRPLDGGVSLTTLGNAMGLQTVRQTRRYFRYQSGKAIQFSTGAKFTPTYDIVSISGAGVTTTGTKVVTVTTLQDHGLQPGATILMEGTTLSTGLTSPYNGTFTVTTVTGTNVFTYNMVLSSALQAQDAVPGGVNIFVTVTKWKGAATRTGMFDEQNGFYFEYDGESMYAVRRFSNKEISGTINVTANSGLITGNNTQFRRQLLIGDKIVIRGQSYQIAAIDSDTVMYVSPSYRGATGQFVRACKTQEIRVRSDEWNQDKMDGRGPGGYLLDPNKMQMVYIDYTWYGAGYIRWGFRAIKGDIVYVHRMANNNINTAAYQRSGNLPARYEVMNEPKRARLVGGATLTYASTLNPNDTTMYVDNVSEWPTSGYILIRNSTSNEVAQYTAIGSYNSTMRGYPLTIVRRVTYPIFFPGQVVILGGGNTGTTSFSPDTTLGGSGVSQTAVITLTQTCAPQISHWGSSVIMDGRFDQDAEYVFTAGMTKRLAIPNGVTRPLMAVRLAPSVDNAVARNFGIRELINRMQMRLVSVGVTTNGQFLIQGFINPGTITYTNHASTAFNITKTGTGVSGQSTVSVTDIQNISVGMTTVSGPAGFPIGAVVVAISGTTITLSSPNTAGYTSATNLVFGGVRAYAGLPTDWDRERVGAGSLSQVLYFDNSGPIGGIVPTGGAAPSGALTGGDAVFSFYSENGGGGTNFNVTSYDLKAIRELGNSILSGNGNPSSPSYPNGPDILVITATNIGTASSEIAARISWTEAQA